MAGKYGCPWTNIICIQSCGCCKNCKKANESKYSSPECACGIWRNHRNEPEIQGDKAIEGRKQDG